MAVAWDRLGNDDKALAVMARKLARMKALKTPGNADSSGDTPWYRYNANAGTFLAHRYLRHPGRYPLSDLDKGRALIAESIRVNPHAHFGREKVQLAVMDWLIEGKTGGGRRRLGDYIRRQIEAEAEAGSSWSEAASEWRKGLEGLIVLGGAWESPDVFGALSQTYANAGNREMAGLASYRGGELLEHGGRTLLPGVQPHVYTPMPGGARWSTASNFLRLRKEAEDWHARRTAYMMARLRAGHHPDTDPTFWADWHEPPAPKLVDKPWYAKVPFTTAVTLLILVALPLVVFAGIPIYAIRHWRREGFVFAEFMMLGVFYAVVCYITLAMMFPFFATTR